MYEGTVLTVDKDDSVARYLVEDDGRICYVGNELPTQYAGWRRVELGSKALCPSFVDTHQHMASFAAFNAGLNVMDARSNAEIVERVREFAAHSDDKTLIAFGASPYSVADGRLVSRGELDDACPDKPLMLVKYDGHACIVNSALLEKVRGKVSELRGYHPDTGEMNQEAFFAVSDFITSSISIPKLVRNVQRTMDYLAARGIGMVHTVSGVGFSGDLDISLEVWLARSAQSGFQVRVFPQSMDISVAKRRGLPRIGGCFACALDGCFGSADAALNEPYAGTGDDCGVLYYSDEQVAGFCKAANRAGLATGRSTRRLAPSRRRLTTFRAKTTATASSMTACPPRRGSRSAPSTVSSSPCRRRLSTGRRSRTPTCSGCWETSARDA